MYIEKEKVAAVLPEPCIQRVPEADETIQGISYENGEFILYYRFGEWMESPKCGIVLKTDGNIKAGLAAEMAAEEEAESSELTAVMPGVWERKSD